MSERATLALGCAFSDRIEALLDGRVTIEGFETRVSCVEPQKLFRQVLAGGQWDLAELSMGSHIASAARGRRDYVGLPVFLSRSFRHSNLYVRTDRGIDSPGDLAGKRIGLVDFQQTAALWLRGLLDDDYGVARESIAWTTAGLHAPVLEDRMAGGTPPGITIARSPETLDALLRTGEIDAVISPTAPRCFADPAVPVARMWHDPRAAELAYWRERRIFPIMHVAVLRRSLADAHPGLAEAATEAFEAARKLAVTDVMQRDFPKVALPWISNHAATIDAELGGNPWTYGLEANRDTLATMLRYAVADGLAEPGLEPEDLFV